MEFRLYRNVYRTRKLDYNKRVTGYYRNDKKEIFMEAKIVSFLSKIKPKYYMLISFVLTCLTAYMMFSYQQVLSTGKYIIMNGDVFQQYVPFIKMFVRDILNGEALSYSWSLSMGMNTALCYAYYVLSPFNLLYLLLYFVEDTVVTAIVMILKIALAAAFFQRFSNKVLGCHGAESIVFSIFYAMCAFSVIYNVLNLSWMDSLYIVPLLCILLNSLVKEGKWKALVFVYSYLFITQFYMAYIVGIFSCIYLIVLLYVNKCSVKNVLYKMLKYALAVALAIMVAAAILLPALLFLLENRSTVEILDSLQVNIAAVLKNMFWGQAQGIEGIYPYIYCGIPSILLAICFLFNQKINRRIKIAVGILTLFFVVCMFWPFAYSAIHAFDFPDFLGFRFSFLISFVICSMACYQSRFLNEAKKKILILSCGIGVIFYIIAKVIDYHEMRIDATEPIGILLVNIAICAMWILLLYAFQNGKLKKEVFTVVIIFVTMIEVISNGMICDKRLGNNKKESHYDVYKESINEAMAFLEEDDSFYRVQYLNDYCVNSDSWFGYYGMTDFNSAVNKIQQNSLRNLGFMMADNKGLSYGLTPVTEMLFGIKYRIIGVNPYVLSMDKLSPVIEECDYVLGLGYMTDKQLFEYEQEEQQAFDNLDALLTDMTGVNIDCFKSVEEAVVTEENAVLFDTDNGINIQIGENKESVGYITYSVPIENESLLYAYFQRNRAFWSDESPELLGGYENSVSQEGDLTNPYIKEMCYNDNAYEVVIEIRPEHAQTVMYQDILFSVFDEQELQKAYNILSQNQMLIEDYGNDFIHANITVPEDKTVLFTSIPYDSGWKVYVDGIQTQTVAVVGDAFLALELESGYHELDFEYEAPGARLGMSVSGIGVSIYVLILVADYIINKRRKLKER